MKIALLAAETARLPAIADSSNCTAGSERYRSVVRISMIKSSEKAIEVEGTILTVLPGTMFRVALANQHSVLAHISGKMRKRFIRLTIGDRVKMQMSPYDTAKARIVYRL